MPKPGEKNNSNNPEEIEEANEELEQSFVMNEENELDQSLENNNELDQAFVQYDEEREAAYKWFDNLQTVLDDAGCELDLNVPEDTVRLNIFKIDKLGPDNYKFTMTYGLDPDQRPINMKKITKEDALGRQGKVSTLDDNSDTIVNLYNAAKNGELIVTSHNHAKTLFKQRQIYVGENGLPVVGNDIDHLTNEEAKAIELLDPPRMPQPLEQKTLDAIAVGDKHAIDELNSYNNSLRKYNEDYDIWQQAKEMEHNDPATYQRVYNLGVIMQQFYGNFWDPGVGEARIAYGKMTGEMHREYVYRNMTEQERSVHQQLDTLDYGMTMTRINLMRAAAGKKVADNNIRDMLAKLIVDRHEMLRAEEAIKNGKFEEYKPLSEEEYAKKIDELKYSDNFANGVHNLKMGDIQSLATKEDEKYYAGIDKLEAKINSLGDHFVEEEIEDEIIEEEKPIEVKPEVIPASGISSGIGKLFTDINTKNAGYNMREFLVENVKIPRDKEGRPLYSEEELAGLDEEQQEDKKKHLSQQECDYIMSNPKEIADKISGMDYFKYDKLFDVQTLSEYLRSINPVYKSLPVNEQLKREEYSQKLREKHNRYAVNRELAIAAVNAKPPRLDRTDQTLLEPHFNELSMLTNERRKQILKYGTPEEKQAMYLEVFNDIASKDITKIDILDNQSLLDNFDEVADIMSVTVELTALLRDAEEAGLDLREEKYKPMIEKLAAVKEYGYMARMRIDVLSHPLYSQVDVSQIEDKYFGQSATKANGEEITASDDFEDFFAQKYGYKSSIELMGYGAFFSQVGMTQFQKKGNPIFDKSLSPEQRLAKFREGYWTSGNELMPKEPKIKKVNGEWIKVDEDGYDDFVDESELGDGEKINEKNEKELEEFLNEENMVLYDEIIDKESPKEEIQEKIEIEKDQDIQPENEKKEVGENKEFKVVGENIRTGIMGEGLPNIDQFRKVQEEVKSRHDTLKEMFRKNITLIQQNVDKDFSMTNEEIEAYITPERIAMHDWAVEYNRKVAEVHNNFKDKVPPMFSRTFYALADKSGTPEAQQKNEEMAKLLSEKSARGDKYRAELYAKLANDVRKLDDDKISFDKGFDSMAAYTMENIDTLEVGQDFQKINERRVSDFSLMSSPEDEVNLKNIENKGVVIGGVGRSIRETMQSDLFLTFPFDKLNGKRITNLVSVAKQLQHTGDEETDLTDQIGKIATYAAFKVHKDKFVEPEIRDIKAEDLKSPSVVELKEQYEEMRKELLKAENWYNFKNSDEYKNLLTSLKQAITCMSDIDGAMTREKGVELYNTVKDVQTKAGKYVQHVGDQGKNDIQETRLQIAKKAKSISGNIIKPYVFETMVGKHNDLYYEAVENTPKEYYDEVRKTSGYGPQEKQDFVPIEQLRERIFERGLRRTENLRTETISLEEKKDRTPQEEYLLKVNNIILDAREKLTNLVGRAEIDSEHVRPLMAIVAVGNSMKEKYKNNLNGEKAIHDLMDTVSKSKIMKELTKKVDSDMINNFLEGGGESKVLDSIIKARKAEKAAQEKDFKQAKDAFKDKPEIKEKKEIDDFSVNKNSGGLGI